MGLAVILASLVLFGVLMTVLQAMPNRTPSRRGRGGDGSDGGGSTSFDGSDGCGGGDAGGGDGGGCD